jgi:hypothetical protein
MRRSDVPQAIAHPSADVEENHCALVRDLTTWPPQMPADGPARAPDPGGPLQKDDWLKTEMAACRRKDWLSIRKRACMRVAEGLRDPPLGP